MIEGCRQTVCLSSDMKLLITETSISLFVTTRNEVGYNISLRIMTGHEV